MKNLVLIPLALIVLAIVIGCECNFDRRGSGDTPQPQSKRSAAGADRQTAAVNADSRKLAIITNNASIYWKTFVNGVQKYASERNLHFDIELPPHGTAAEQDDIIASLIGRAYNGIAVSVISPEEQLSVLDQAALKSRLITFDADAPKSERLLFVGIDDREAGRKLGDRIVKLLPGGGKVAVFVGSLRATSATERIEGIRSAIANHPIEIALEREDLTDRLRDRKNVDDVLASRPDITLLCGIWSYNGPAIAQALRASGRQGKVLAVCFDDEPDTLAAIEDGTINATLIQQPFEMGYRTAAWLDKLTRSNSAAIPADKFVDVGTRLIDRSNLAEMKRQLAEWAK